MRGWEGENGVRCGLCDIWGRELEEGAWGGSLGRAVDEGGKAVERGEGGCCVGFGSGLDPCGFASELENSEILENGGRWPDSASHEVVLHVSARFNRIESRAHNSRVCAALTGKME